MAVNIWEGAKVDELIAAIEGLAGSGNSGMSDAAKAALINCFLKVAWVDDSGAELIQALTTALYGGDASDNRLVYELKNTDISNTPIDTGVPVFQLGESFTILARVTMNQWPADKTTNGAYVLNHGNLSRGTLRFGVDIVDNEIKFINNVMYGDVYMNSISGYAGGVVSPNTPHNIVWMARMSGTFVKRVLYIDGVKAVSKEENVSSQAGDKTFTGNYVISAGSDFPASTWSFPGTAKLIRIYNEALSASEIEAIMGLEF